MRRVSCKASLEMPWKRALKDLMANLKQVPAWAAGMALLASGVPGACRGAFPSSPALGSVDVRPS